MSSEASSEAPGEERSDRGRGRRGWPPATEGLPKSTLGSDGIATGQALAAGTPPDGPAAAPLEVERNCPECNHRGPHKVTGERENGAAVLKCGHCGHERDGRLSAEERESTALPPPPAAA